MLDLRSIREDPEPARAALRRRGAAEQLDELLSLDERRREILPQVEEGRAHRNRVSDQIAQLMSTLHTRIGNTELASLGERAG